MAISGSSIRQNPQGSIMQQMSSEVVDLYKHFQNLAQTKRAIDTEERKQKAAQMQPYIDKLIQDRGGVYAFLRS